MYDSVPNNNMHIKTIRRAREALPLTHRLNFSALTTYKDAQFELALEEMYLRMLSFPSPSPLPTSKGVFCKEGDRRKQKKVFSAVWADVSRDEVATFSHCMHTQGTQPDSLDRIS